MTPRLAALRNVAIIAAIAAVIVVVPGGGRGASVVSQALQLAFLATLGYFAFVSYRQHRVALYSLGDRKRTILYVAAAVATLTLTGTHRLWATAGGSVAWLVLIALAAYAVFAVILSARRY